ncbi:MAG: SRPBCC domain-containing protein [Bacteroidetes bacterium]|nr:SRPBCC domain-containing protein [Bacteroidota bacterium]
MAKKIKYQLEFPIHASPHFIYQFLVTPSGLSEWFADNVNSRGELFTFFWDGVDEEVAKLLAKRQDERVKFKWVEDTEDEYFFEFKIQVDEITKDVSLIVTDFAEADELESAKMLWENQIDELKHIIGA